jgi:tRNA nucleotidyltransferase (CCA-adding enzyme)
MGVRGFGSTKAKAFEQAALALVGVVTEVERVRPTDRVDIGCEAPDDELLLVDWLNAVVYEMATRRMVFGRFDVHLDGTRLRATASGEPVDRIRHEPRVEVKGATYTEVAVTHDPDQGWIAQCVVDV